jgi:hypothetical protein
MDAVSMATTLYLLANFVDDFHQVAAIGAPQDMGLFLQNHPFTDLFGQIRLEPIDGRPDEQG